MIIGQGVKKFKKSERMRGEREGGAEGGGIINIPLAICVNRELKGADGK